LNSTSNSRGDTRWIVRNHHKLKTKFQGTLKTRYFLVYLARMCVRWLFCCMYVHETVFCFVRILVRESIPSNSHHSMIGSVIHTPTSFNDWFGHPPPAGPALSWFRLLRPYETDSRSENRLPPLFGARKAGGIGTFSGKGPFISGKLLVYREKWCIL